MKMKKWLKCLLMTMTLMMVVNVGTVSTTIPAAAKAAAESVKVGKKFWSGKFQYKVTSVNGTEGTAALIGTKSKNLTSVSVPEKVKAGKCTLTVSAIGDGAFKNCKKLKKVATNKSISKIGKNAFSGCTKLKAVSIKSAELKSIGKGAIPKQAVVTTTASPATVTSTAAAAAPVTAAASTLTVQNPAPVSNPVPASNPTPASKPATASNPATASSPTPVSNPAPASNLTAAAPSPSAEEKAPAAASAATMVRTPASVEQTEKKAPTCGKKHLGLVVVESVAPTCTTMGWSSYEYCTVCGYSTQRIPLSKAPHDMVLQPGQTATCTRQGWNAYYACRNCGYHEPIHYVSAKGHSYGEWMETVAPTCTTAGSKQRLCTSCGTRQTGTVPAKGHSFGAWKETIAPEAAQPSKNICNVLYYQERSCESCGATEKGNVSVKHKAEYLVKQPDVLATCTQAGKTNVKRCSICGQEFFSYVKPLGHNFCTEPTVEPATCGKDGLSYRQCVHEGCTERTDVHTIPASGAHKWETCKEEATCTEPGFDGQICEICGKKEGTVIPKTAHKYETTTVLPTCTTDGSEKMECSVCHAVVTKVIPRKVDGHKWVEHAAETATCSKEGHSAYTQCALCGAYQGAEPVRIPATRTHTWGPAYSVCSTMGLSEAQEAEWTDVFRECSECGRKTIVAPKAKNWNTGTGTDLDGAFNKAIGNPEDLSSFIEFNLFIAPKGSAWTSCYGNEAIRGARGFSEIWINGEDYECYFMARRCTNASFAQCAPMVNGNNNSWELVTAVNAGEIIGKTNADGTAPFYKSDGCIYITE